MNETKAPVRVFISYSHDSDGHADRVLALADQLRKDGLDAWIDQYETAPPRGWPRWMEKQVEQADFVLCVCTETYRRRFDQEEAPGTGLGVTWEAALVRIALYLAQGENRKFLPTLLSPGDAVHIPTRLQEFHRFQLDSRKGYDALYRHLTGQPATNAPPLGEERTLSPRPRLSLFGSPVGAAPAGDDLLDGYGAWARTRYGHLDLIGIDAGDVQVKLEEVYVPLRMSRHPAEDDAGRVLHGGWGRRGEGEHETVEIEDVLRFPRFPSRNPDNRREQEPRHVLIFGEPGSGKTTALLKLQQLCWDSATALGLPEGTVPVFLRLRHLSKDLLDDKRGLAVFIESEVQQQSGGRQTGLGEKLWQHGKLLLLCDGLDEIADEKHRTRVLRRIAWDLRHRDAAQMRAVVSCRRVGLPSRKADRDRQFQSYEVRPLQDEQIATLVTQWFRELARHGKIQPATAEQRVSTLLGALSDRKTANQQILEMVSNPLLLTLLCVVVLLGNEIPKKRVRFYEQCLEVLLDRWPRQRGKDVPLELTTARDALGRLAFFLHAAQRRDDLSWAEAVVELKEALDERELAMRFFTWVHRDVGLLVDYTEEAFGFAHLGLQEHLTARHLVAHPEDLGFIKEGFEESWWTEVFLQISALSEREGFAALTSQLLAHTDTLERRAGLLRDCLGETSRPELSAFVGVLNEGNPARQAAVLRLLRGTEHRPAELNEALERLSGTASPEVRTLAEQILDAAAPPEREEQIALLFDSANDRSLADKLARRLRDWEGGWSVTVFEGIGRKTGEALAPYKAVVVLVGSREQRWKGATPLRALYGDKTWLVLAFPGEPQPVVPEVFSGCKVLVWHPGKEDALVEAIIQYLPRPASEPVQEFLQVRGLSSKRGSPTVIGQSEPYTEPTTGVVFLPVPGGTFMMGSSSSACRVRLSLFWLAQKPVTNAQYGRFLAATDHAEPPTWRDRRFSAPEQPVVSVSWEDATAFCRWLSETHPEGYEFQLPSEAQWEFAARGPGNSTYPWGEDHPNSKRACYNLNYSQDKPAAVGSYPEGAGPFGHLDLVGLVWEWCRDSWDPDLSHWAAGEPLDPVGEGDPNTRPVRGGSWNDIAASLRSAIRLWGEARLQYVSIGFRLLCLPRV